ncbi:MAG: ATP-dependent Clp protease adaptor ClpS [Bacteroides sp.]|nr:ATP-dependent Clp protease adaptor ClpS [Bacteroides sp.]
MPSTQQNQNVLDRTRYHRPENYDVIFHNDDFTPMDFVTFVLRAIFFLPGATSEAIMLKVHTEGKAVVGSYPYDMARSRADLTISRAREEGFPLNVTVEPSESPF